MPRQRSADNVYPFKPDRRPTNPVPTGGQISKPKKLTKRASEIWDETVANCPWLMKVDTPMCALWCELSATIEKDPVGTSVLIRKEWRLIGNSLGFSPGARTALASGESSPTPNDPVEDLFSRSS